MINIILKIVLLMFMGTYTFSFAGKNYNNKTINAVSSKSDKTFTREYTYSASEDDSKNSSRKKAITQLKSLLSEEVGTHIESSLDIKETAKKGVSTQYVKSEINSLSASITKLKVLNEKWNGVTYYIKASVKINEEQTMMLLIEAIKAKASQKDLKRLNKILKEQNGHLDKSYNKIQKLQKELVLQEIKNQASKNELADTKKVLQKLQREKKKYDNKIIEQKSEIEKIQKLVQKAKNRIKKDNKKACLMVEGMTNKEVLKIIGLPLDFSSIRYQSYNNRWKYGTVEIIFDTSFGFNNGYINSGNYEFGVKGVALVRRINGCEVDYE